jgi:preprotein translocase subunit SecF
MSDEGLRLVSRLALLVVLILVAALMRTMVGPSRRRARVMAVGTVAGMAFGVLVAVPVSRWFGADTSAIGALMGLVLGWGISWQFARKIPRTA